MPQGVFASKTEQIAQAGVMMHDRASGMTLQAIADKHDCSIGTVQGRLDLATKVILSESVETRRATQNEQLDKLMDAVTPSALAGDEKMIDKLLKIMDRSAKLNGLDMPTKVEATVLEVTQEDLAVAEMLREAKARMALDEARLADADRG